MEEETTIKPRSGRYLVWLALLTLIVVVALFWGRGKTVAPGPASISAPAINSADGHKAIVPIEIDTAGRTINAAEVYLKFDSTAVQVESVGTEDSIFTIKVKDQPAFSNQKGEITFAAGLPNPGFKGKGKIGSVTLVSKAPIKTQLTFDSRTQALLNDGQGTAIPLQLQPIGVEIK